MKSIFIFLGAIFILTGCEPNQVVLNAPKPVVFIPDEKFFNCPTIDNFNITNRLTDGQIATLLVKLDTNNRVCKRSIDAIKAQLLEAKARLEVETR